MTIEECYKVVESVFLDHPHGQEAKSFIVHYDMYCSLIDDLIDGDKLMTSENLLRSHISALEIYSSNFYRSYTDRLYPVIRSIHHIYADSCTMEKSTEEWQLKQADVLRHIGLELTLTVIEILAGYEMRRKLSIPLREASYRKHHDQDGKPI